MKRKNGEEKFSVIWQSYVKTCAEATETVLYKHDNTVRDHRLSGLKNEWQTIHSVISTVRSS